MNFKKVVADWIENKGKVWLFRTLTLGVLGLGILMEIDPFKWFTETQTPVIILAMPAILFLLLEIIISTTSNLQESLRQSQASQVLTWSEATPLIRDRVKTANSIDIIASSSESIYLILRDALEKSNVKSVRVLLRQWKPQDVKQYYKLLYYDEQWRAIKTTNGQVIDIRYCDNTSLRGVIFDKNEGYLGHYEWSNEERRFRGYDVPVVHVSNKTDIGRHFLSFYNNRFDYYWNEGKPLMQPERVTSNS